MTKVIEELESIRKRLTEIYMKLGNPDYLEADSVLNEDISKLTLKSPKENHSQLPKDLCVKGKDARRNSSEINDGVTDHNFEHPADTSKLPKTQLNKQEEKTMSREEGTCPQCEEEELIHNIGDIFECNNCEMIWDESLSEDIIQKSVDNHRKVFCSE